MDKIQKFLVTAGRKDLAQEYYEKIANQKGYVIFNFRDGVRIQFPEEATALYFTDDENTARKFINKKKNFDYETVEALGGGKTIYVIFEFRDGKPMWFPEDATPTYFTNNESDANKFIDEHNGGWQEDVDASTADEDNDLDKIEWRYETVEKLK